MLEVVGSVPQYITRIYEKQSSWLRNLLTSTKPEVRQLAAKVYGVIAAPLPINDFGTQISEITAITNKKNLEPQHGGLLALTYMMERRLLILRKNMNESFNWDLYINVVKMICMYFMHIS